MPHAVKAPNPRLASGELGMTTLNLTLPNSIQRHLHEMSDREGVPIEQFIASAVAEKISAITATDYLSTRASRADSAAFQVILDRVPDRDPLPGDHPSQQSPRW